MRFEDGRNEIFPIELGELSVEHTEEVYYRIGQSLKEVGIDINLAPVADIWMNPTLLFLRHRCFGSDPSSVADHVAGAVRGLHKGGVGACLKHFPGHGGASANTHSWAALDPIRPERWVMSYALPFQEGILEEPECVMSAHVQYGGLDDSGVPATFSKVILGTLLRDRLHFKGCVLSDALNMKAILRDTPPPEAVCRALLAGCDLCLLCEDDLDGTLYSDVLPAVVERIKKLRGTDGEFANRYKEAFDRVSVLLDGRSASKASKKLAKVDNSVDHFPRVVAETW